MGGMKVSELDFVRLLPAFMQDDEAAIALSKAMNQLVGEPSKRLNTLRTWDKIGELNEAECDELAWELDVDWYDSTGMSLEEKRATIELARQIKRKRGTKWAVEHLISAYFGEGYVMEWYDIGERPYTFVVLTTNTHVKAENYGKFVEAVKAAKNERSRILGVFYFWPQGPDPGIECAASSNLHRYEFKKCGTYPRASTTGFGLKATVETEPTATLHKYKIKRCSENNPKKCITLADTATGKSYFLYVSSGELTMGTTSGKATKKSVIFDDRTTGERYSLYVSSGKLTMETTSENVAINNIIFDDHATGERYSLYVSSGELTMAAI